MSSRCLDNNDEQSNNMLLKHAQHAHQQRNFYALLFLCRILRKCSCHQHREYQSRVCEDLQVCVSSVQLY
jgi:hypothetical protein